MRKIRGWIIEFVSVFFALVLYGIPFYFVILNSVKTQREAAELSISLPDLSMVYTNLIDNYSNVLTSSDGMVIRAFFNSTMITTLSIAGLIIVCSMAAFQLQRRQTKITAVATFLILAGLMIPASVVPTIWVLKNIHLYKTLIGMILIEIALTTPFTIILYKGFMATIPREIDEAAIIDGCTRYKLFFEIILPLLKPVTATVIILSAINIFNDFANPLYFLPGAKNATVQLTLYNFSGKYSSSWNLLFADVVLISLPLLILFIFFNKQIVAGMTAGSVKG